MTEFLNRATDWLRTNIRLSAVAIYLGALGLTALVFIGFLLFNIFAKKRGKATARGYFGSVAVIAAIACLLNMFYPSVRSAFFYVDNVLFAPVIVIMLGGILNVVLAVVSKPRRKKETYETAPPAGEIKVEEPAAEETADIVREAPAKEPEPAAEPVIEPPVFTQADDEPSDPEKEDIVVQIERIATAGASKNTMLEIAKLLQAERAKAENKSPDRQKRLNSALAKLLKALSTAN